MLNLCGIVAAILKMATGKNFSMSEINSEHHYLPKMAATIPQKFNIVRFQRPELIPDIEKFLPVSIFKMTTTIPQKFNIVRFPLCMTSPVFESQTFTVLSKSEHDTTYFPSCENLQLVTIPA
jgi:hypothetical protein